MKKKQKVLNTVRGFLLFLAALICVIPLSTVRASEMSGTWDIEPEDEAISESAEYGEEMIEKFSFEDIDRSLQDLFPDERVKFKETMMGILSGDLTFSMELVKSLAADQLGYAFGSSRDNLVHMLLIALIAAVFGNFSKTFKSRQIVDISFYAMYLLLIALTLSSFQTVTEWVSEGIESLTSFMSVFCPLYFLAVSIAKGSITSVAFYNLVLFLIFLTEFLILDFLLPLIHIYMIVKVLNYLSEEDYLSKFAELIEMTVSWILKTLLACIVGLNVIQGLISPAIDTVKRSAVTKGAEAIPGVGDIIGGVAEVALGTAVLVKNGIGMAGAIICIALCMVPLVQVAGIVLLYKLAAAVIQPVSDKRIVGCVETVGEGCRLLLHVVFTTSLLFLLTIVVVSAVTGNT